MKSHDNLLIQHSVYSWPSKEESEKGRRKKKIKEGREWTSRFNINVRWNQIYRDVGMEYCSTNAGPSPLNICQTL